VSGEDSATALRLLSSGELERRCEGVDLLARAPGEESTEALVALLEDPSWYLRERVVDALAARSAASQVRRVLRAGPWFARASACDVIARCPQPDAVDDLLEQVADRNVSLQKSAARALARIAEKHGSAGVAGRVAALAAPARRRVIARVGHQQPAWVRELEQALASLPRDAFAATEAQDLPALPRAIGAETRALVRFRRWLAGSNTEARA
jgi:HEAT repeat protein